MRQVPVTMPWITNAYENSGGHSVYYLDMHTGNVKFLDPMDFPEHVSLMKKYDEYPDRFVKLPKRDENFCLKVKEEYAATVEDPFLRESLEKAVSERKEKMYRSTLMSFAEERRRWYDFENERYREFLLAWFREKGLELVDRPSIDALECNKKR